MNGYEEAAGFLLLRGKGDGLKDRHALGRRRLARGRVLGKIVLRIRRT
jgi:hypothetical protein